MNCYLGVPLESQTTNLPLADTFPTKKKKLRQVFPCLAQQKTHTSGCPAGFVMDSQS